VDFTCREPADYGTERRTPGSYIVYASGGLVLTGVTWLVTRKQIRYFNGRKTDIASHEPGEARGR
jgi:hypothetical protein